MPERLQIVRRKNRWSTQQTHQTKGLIMPVWEKQKIDTRSLPQTGPWTVNRSRTKLFASGQAGESWKHEELVQQTTSFMHSVYIKSPAAQGNDAQWHCFHWSTHYLKHISGWISKGRIKISALELTQFHEWLEPIHVSNWSWTKQRKAQISRTDHKWWLGDRIDAYRFWLPLVD